MEVNGIASSMETSTTFLKEPFSMIKWCIYLSLIVLSIIALISGFVLYNLLHPERQELNTIPEQFQLPYQNVTFASKDPQVQLKGWWIPSEQNNGKVVILVHGYSDNRSTISAALPTAKALHDQGYATLLFDFRNSGESGGSLTTVGVEEKKDLHGAIQYVKTQGYQKIGLLGFSMGASTAIVTASERKDIQALVVDSPFSDLRPYLEENLPVWSGLPHFFTPIILFFAEIFGIQPAEIRPIKAIQKLKTTPMLFIHTKKDPAIPVTESEKIAEVYGATSDHKWWSAGNKHVDSFKTNPQQYLKRVTQFFNHNLQ